MKSAVFYFKSSLYEKLRDVPGGHEKYLSDYVRFEIRDGEDIDTALETATPKEGETVLNSVLLEE